MKDRYVYGIMPGYITPCEVCGKLISVSALQDMDLCFLCASLLRDEEPRPSRLVVSKRGRERKKRRDDEGA